MKFSSSHLIILSIILLVILCLTFSRHKDHLSNITLVHYNLFGNTNDLWLFLLDFVMPKGKSCLIFLMWEFVAMSVKGLFPHAMPWWIVDFKCGLSQSMMWLKNFRLVHDLIRGSFVNYMTWNISKMSLMGFFLLDHWIFFGVEIQLELVVLLHVGV